MPPSDDLRLLLVDDDPAILRSYGRALGHLGAKVEIATNGKEAVERLKGGTFDVVVSDVMMPEMTGIDLLKAARAQQLDVPIVLMTCDPSLDSAVPAVEYGAFRYLSKPVGMAELWETVNRDVRLHKMARLKREALTLPIADLHGDRSAPFTSGLELMWMAFQPIVKWSERKVFGHEALLRSDEPSMKNPAHMLDAAEKLGRLHELGRAVRARVTEAASEAPEGNDVFVNLHSADLNDDDLYSVDSPLSTIASRVVLEITERASLDAVKDVASRVARLKALGFRIAIDDLGAGYAGLTSFTQLEPEIVKLDMSLVRNVDTCTRRQSIVRSMTKLCGELGMLVVAEGVETPTERDMLVELGCDLLQGYLFARPQRGFALPQW